MFSAVDSFQGLHYSKKRKEHNVRMLSLSGCDSSTLPSQSTPLSFAITGPRDIRCWTESPKIVIISDSYKNIMEKRKKHEAPLCICSPVGAGLIGFNSLPVELCSMIFLVAQQTEAELLKARALLLVILC